MRSGIRLRDRAFVVVALLACAGLPAAARAQDQTPAVLTGAYAYNTSWVYDDSQYPTSPLISEAAGGSGNYTAWANATPGCLKARATCGTTPEPWYNSRAYATFVEHFHPARAGLPANGHGDFVFSFVLSGTLRISATDYSSYAQVAINAFSMHDPDPVGHLELGRVGSTVMLYGLGGEVAPGSYPENNMFANPDGSRRVYQTVTSPAGGYYTATFRIPVRMVFPGFPFNPSPVERTWDNRIDFTLSAVAFRGAVSDFSATFEFAEQNPIVPDPDDPDLPHDGWTFTCASDEIALPGPAEAATATGSGNATFAVDDGAITGLAAVDGATLPQEGMPGGFAHGFFALDVAGLTPGGTVTLSMRLPADMASGAHWWYHDAVAGWSYLELADDDGDELLELTVTDGGAGDATGADGTVSLTGGPSPAAIPEPVMLASFTATAGDGAVAVSWIAHGAPSVGFRLVARLGADVWEVPFAADGQGGFTARDAHALLAGGGAVTYELWFEGELVATRAVTLAPPAVPVALWPAAPNPFNPRTRVAFSVYAPQRVRVGVYDLAGRAVALLADGPHAPGAYVVEWEGRDAAGRAMPSGTYLVRLEAEQRVQSRLVSLVR